MKTEPNDLIGCAPATDENTFIPGLTKREYFAAMAMQGLCVSRPDRTYEGHYRHITKDALGIADSLIEALNKATG